MQRPTFRDGKRPATGADPAQGGAAIRRDGGSLTVLDSVFDGAFTGDAATQVRSTITAVYPVTPEHRRDTRYSGDTEIMNRA